MIFFSPALNRFGRLKQSSSSTLARKKQFCEAVYPFGAMELRGAGKQGLHRQCFKNLIFSLWRLRHLDVAEGTARNCQSQQYPPQTPILPSPLVSTPPNHTPSCQAHSCLHERARKRMLKGDQSKGQTGCPLGSAERGGVRKAARLLGWAGGGSERRS